MFDIASLIKRIDDKQKIIINNRPLEQKQVLNLCNYYKVDFVYASNAIEGSTLTLSETKVVIEDGITIGGKSMRDHLDAIGNAKAFDYIWELAKEPVICEQDIKKIHQICFQANQANAGQYRDVNVLISGSEYNELIPDYKDVPKLMREFCQNLPEQNSNLHPAVYAANIHRQFVYIHPFVDGNGRVARLIMNQVLLANGYPIVVIPPRFKNNYINALEKSRKNTDIFVQYILEQLLQAQTEYIRLLKL